MPFQVDYECCKGIRASEASEKKILSTLHFVPFDVTYEYIKDYSREKRARRKFVRHLTQFLCLFTLFMNILKSIRASIASEEKTFNT